MMKPKPDKTAVARLVADQLSQIDSDKRRESLQTFLVTPKIEQREFDYGYSGERRDVWQVAVSPQYRIAIVYAAKSGFGDCYSWGIVGTQDDSMGMDSDWHLSFDHAFMNSPLWEGPLPAGYEVP